MQDGTKIIITFRVGLSTGLVVRSLLEYVHKYTHVHIYH